MVYKNSYFNKELKEAYIIESVSRKNSIVYGCIYVVITMALHLVLNTLSDTVLYDWLPEIMIPSNFSVIFLYNIVALILFIIYFIANYRYLTFQEISDNRWYPLIKNGYSINKMVTEKLLARFFRVLIVYTVGFIGCLLLCSLIGYQLILHYLFSLYFVGITDILLIYMISLTISNFVKKSRYMSWVVLIVYVLVRVVQKQLGYYDVVRNRALMTNFSNLFSMPGLAYILIETAVFAVCIGITYAVASYKSKRFSMTKICEAQYYMDYKSNKVAESKVDKVNAEKVTNAIVTSVIVVLVLVLLAFNIAVLLMTDYGGLNTVAIKPILFESSTMSPEINNNDLAFFEKTDEDYVPKTGDIILFNYDGQDYVEKIIEIGENGTVIVDITNYPTGTEEGYFLKTIDADIIERTYKGSDRGLGALITFSRTFFGRIVMLVLPILLILYRKNIVKWFVRRHPTYADELDEDMWDERSKAI